MSSFSLAVSLLASNGVIDSDPEFAGLVNVPLVDGRIAIKAGGSRGGDKLIIISSDLVGISG